MIVDDSSIMRSIIRRALGQSGIDVDEVIEAENGAEGLRSAVCDPPDLIFTDINMPTMDGITMVRQLRRNTSTAETPIIVVSTDGSQEVLETANEAGANGFVTKPFSPELLLTHLAELGIEITPTAGEGADF
jgi:two-component system chemotaxis response regulator CheY